VQEKEKKVDELIEILNSLPKIEKSENINEILENVLENATSLEPIGNLVINVEENTEIRKQIKLKNSGQYIWKKYCTFVCLNNKDKNFYLRGNDVNLKLAIKPGETINVEIIIPASRVQKGKYISVWQLRNENNEYFGEQVTLEITVNSKNSIKILEPEIATVLKVEPTNVRKEKIKLYQNGVAILKSEESLKKLRPLMEEMRNTYSIDGIADIIILNALDKAGNIENALALLF